MKVQRRGNTGEGERERRGAMRGRRSCDRERSSRQASVCSCAAEGGRAHISAALCSVVKQAGLSLPFFSRVSLSRVCSLCLSSTGNQETSVR